jgi:methyl acetate hydrolase
MTTLQESLAGAVKRAGVPGAVALVGDREGVVFAGAFGTRGVDDRSPMGLDTLFWFASMTKAVTSVAAMQLVEQGRLALDEPVGAWLPKLAEPMVIAGFDSTGAPILRPARRAITLRHLLTHTSGLGYDFFSADLLRARGPGGPPAASDPAWLETPLLFEPGESWVYGTSTDWVGLAVEAASGDTLDVYFKNHILGPLGMADTAFVIPPAKMARLAPMHARSEDGAVTTIPSMALAMTDAPFFSGGGGLTGTGGDYMRFLRMILNEGRLDGARILKSETVAAMSVNHIGGLRAGALEPTMPHLSRPFDAFPGKPTGWGLGFLINHEPVAGGRAAGSLTWAGLANTHYWIDSAAGLAGLILTQIFPFGDEKVMAMVGAFERAAYEVI